MSNIASVSLSLLGLAPTLAGCFLGAGIPFTLDAKERALDLDGERARLEGELCADPASADCAVLTALDASDGATSTPPSLPAVLPRQLQRRDRVDAESPDVLDVEPWLVDTMAEHGFVPAQGFPLSGDGAAALRDAVQRASLEEAVFVYRDNTLSFELPPFEVWVGPAGVGEIGAAIADGALDRIAVTEPLPASMDSEAPLTFSDGGTDRLLEAVRDGESLVVRPDPKTPFALALGTTPETLKRPGGSVTITLRLSGSVAVTIDGAIAR